MDWSDEGIVLRARKHGESAAIVSLLTRNHGRHMGLVRGGAGRSKRSLMEPGNLLDAEWRARLADHLGTYTVELDRAYSAAVLDDPLRLAVLSSACAVADGALPEREPHAAIFSSMLHLLGALTDDKAGGHVAVWSALYVRWELDLLRDLGFGLDLSVCAATGSEDGLAYVSPRSGRAVSLAAGEAYRDRLLSLPPFLADGSLPADIDQVARGLMMTGFFLDRHVFGGLNKPLPAARGRMVSHYQRLVGSAPSATISSK